MSFNWEFMRKISCSSSPRWLGSSFQPVGWGERQRIPTMPRSDKWCWPPGPRENVGHRIRPAQPTVEANHEFLL